MSTALPTFDLVVATVDRSDALDGLLASLERQGTARVRVLVVDQNADDRVGPALDRHPALAIERLHSARGLARARNVGLGQLSAELVAFPDDDCRFPDGLLERVARVFADDPSLDGLVGREVFADGTSSASWSSEPAALTRHNLWNRAISFTIFLRRPTLSEVGEFDEQLGLGASGGPWQSGEEIDLLIRALDGGARIRYDPTLTVSHEPKPADRAGARVLARRDGAAVGYLLRKHRYRRRTLARMFLRPALGTVVAIVRLDLSTARTRLATLRGRIAGYTRYPK